VFGARDAISDSDQGKSFRAFWDFLMSAVRQEELTKLLGAVFDLPAVQELGPDRRLLRIHYDWMEAGEVALRTIARLSEQLRRYLDDQLWLENRRITRLLRGIEQHALTIRDRAPDGALMELPGFAPEIVLPLQRTLFTPAIKPEITAGKLEPGSENVPTDALYDQVYVDKARLRSHIRRALQERAQVSLAELVAAQPLEQGLAELVAYMSLAALDDKAVIDDTRIQTVSWTDELGASRQATLPTVTFVR
jgi:hypothetical protein